MRPDELINAAKQALENSYSPYSHFCVGAAILCSDGSVYTGCNIENASYGATICAERAAVCRAVCDGHTDFVAIAIVSGDGGTCTPCGICRQTLYEFAPGLAVICPDDHGGTLEFELDELLPHGFGPKRLEP